MAATTTPGFNCRLEIWFGTEGNGRRIAYRWSPGAFRSIRVSLTDAELWVAQDQATQIAKPFTR